MNRRRLLFSWLGTFALATAAAGQQSIVDSPHNLSASGPGQFKATQESRICIFCHTPHRARTVAPLWNREDSRQTYLTYDSSTFRGTVGQPDGASKLCLSCHDGSIALGAVLSEPTEIEMTAGHRTLSGSALLGTNLTDDHPVSFDYASSAGGSGSEYRPPASIPAPVHLDPDGRVQCTSCHDPHDNSLGSFLLATDRHALLCLACHRPHGWTGSSHATSPATWNGTGADPWPESTYTTVAENACLSCHDPHGAANPERLLRHLAEEDNCLACHDGNVAGADIAAALNRPYAHDPYSTTLVHDPTEDPLSMPRHAECQDCHNPHAVLPGSAAAPAVPGPLNQASGVDSAGQPVDPIQFGYQLCYKCHADNHGATTYVPRQIQQANVRLEFEPGNPSYHPIEAPGANPDVPSLLPPWTEASQVACTDCHQSNDSPAGGGTGAAGPHGSIYEPLLIANYDRTDNISESPSAYALCYRCHNRSSILSNQSFKEHRKHIQGEKTPCSACHDPHGISSNQGTFTNNTHLINFDLSIVQPEPQSGTIQFVDEGVRHGNCTLLCHGENHRNKRY